MFLKKFLIITIMFCVTQVTKCLLNVSFSTENCVLNNFLHKFPNYEFLFHFDNHSQYYLHLFQGIEGLNEPLLFVNYDLLYWDDIKRPVGYQYVHVVFMHNHFEFHKFSQQLFNVENTDIITYIIYKRVMGSNYDNYMKTRVWSQEHNDRAGVVLLIDLDKNLWYYSHFYKGDKSGELQAINGVENINDLSIFVNNFTDFNKHLFNIGFTPLAPYIWCNSINNSISNSQCEHFGIEYLLLSMFSQWLNFNYTLINYEDKKPSPWEAMINAVNAHELDWAVGAISRTTERTLLVDFSNFLKIDGFGTLFSVRNGDFDYWNAVLRPFHTNLWLLILGLIALFAIILTKTEEFLANARHRNFIRFLLVIFKSAVEQSESVKTKYMVIRIIISCWSLTCIILTTAYKSKLAAFMTVTSTKEPNSAIELLEKDYYFQVDNVDWSLLQFQLIEQDDNVYKQILDRCRNNLHLCDAVAGLFTQNIAYIDETFTLYYRVLNECSYLDNILDFHKLRFTKNSMFTTVYSWPFQLNSAYRMKFSKLIAYAHASGHIEHWMKNTDRRQIFKSNQAPVDHNRLGFNIQTFIGPGLMLSLGLFLAFIIFLYETISSKFSCK